MNGLKFKCPKCGCDRLDEICSEVFQASEITDIDVDNIILDYGETSYDGGELSHYQCIGCGFVLEDVDGQAVDTVEELIDWLQNNCPQDTD